MVTYLEPDVLECEVKWTLGSISTNKAGRGDGIPVELFQILKDDAVHVLHSICQQIWKTQHGHRTGKGQFSFHSQRKAMPKNVQITVQLHLFHMRARLCLKSFKLGFNKYVDTELPYVQAEFRKGRGTRDQIATTLWIIQKSRKLNKQTKKATAASLTMLKLLTVWIKKKKTVEYS